MSGFPWPPAFTRVPDEDWTRAPLETLALKYDTVETHGWYDNLEPTVASLAEAVREGQVLVDYSAGTGILARRLLDRIGDRGLGLVLVDASPKFLRVSLERLRDDPRVAFRLMRYRKDERRLDHVDEVLGGALSQRGVDVLVSTNAIHLYYGLEGTLAAWARVVRPGGLVLVQSGNIRNPAMKPGEWIIDETVDAIHEAAVELVRGDSRWAAFRPVLDDTAAMEAHANLRRKVFLPVRPLAHYVAALEAAGFEMEDVTTVTVPASVAEWYEFLAVYHEGVLSWAGGCEKVEGRAPSEDVVADRLALMREAMSRVFRAPTFDACWTHLRCRRR